MDHESDVDRIEEYRMISGCSVHMIILSLLILRHKLNRIRKFTSVRLLVVTFEEKAVLGHGFLGFVQYESLFLDSWASLYKCLPGNTNWDFHYRNHSPVLGSVQGVFASCYPTPG